MEGFVTEERWVRSLARQEVMTPRQLKSLRSWRILASDERALQLFFHTNEQAKAESLARVLRARGCDTTARTMTGDLSSWDPVSLRKPTWVVTGLTPPLSMSEDGLLAWAKDMCHLGLEHDSEFNGWFCATPDFLELNDDYCLQGREDGTLELSLYRWNAASEAALAENDVYWVSPGYELGSLKLLAPYADKIRGLKSPSEELALEDVELLTGLEQIYLWAPHASHGDYRKLPRLTAFRCMNAEKLKPQFLNNPALRRVELRRARKLKSLQELGAWQGLEALALYGAPLTSLEGLSHCASLRELRLAQCRSLSELSGLAQSPGIERLEIFKAPKLQSFEPLAALTELRWIFVYEPNGSLASYETLAHWPHLQSASVLLRIGRIDFQALAQGESSAELLLYTQNGFQLPSEEELRKALESGGKKLRSLTLRPKDECPSIHVTFESPYWRLPGLPAGHARTIVD